MERIKALNRYQKGILLFMIVMILAFAIVYFITISKVGFEYKNEILIPIQQNGNTVYSGELQGMPIRITVTADKIVEVQYSDKIYGPYIAREDSTAIPKDTNVSDHLVGVELRCGEEIIFRGGMLNNRGSRWLYNEDGSMANLGIRIEVGNGIIYDEGGETVDPMEPSVSDILELMDEPELSHKGNWIGWFGGVVICIVAAILILFADELFRWNLLFRIHNADQAEPSDWEIASRYISWTVLPIVAIILFWAGLQ